MERQTEKKIWKMVREIAGIEMQEPQDKNVCLEDIGYDSISKVRLQVEIEDEFGFLFDPLEDDFDEIFSTLEKLYRSVAEKVEQVQ